MLKHWRPFHKPRAINSWVPNPDFIQVWRLVSHQGSSCQKQLISKFYFGRGGYCPPLLEVNVTVEYIFNFWWHPVRNTISKNGYCHFLYSISPFQCPSCAIIFNVHCSMSVMNSLDFGGSGKLNHCLFYFPNQTTLTALLLLFVIINLDIWFMVWNLKL